jgi:CPA1 family monovalent cation:H+ antiporter
VGLGGVVTGFLVGRVGLWVLLKLDDVKAQTVMSLVTAFGSYIVGESVGVSGVISTVTGGLVFGRCLPILSTARTRVEAKTSWDLVLFIINGFVFTMIGFQLPTVIENLHAYSWSQLVVYAVVINVTIIAVRFLWVFPATYLPRLFSPSLRKTDPSPKWQSIVVLGWLGMRGIVSLAATLALPETFPERPLLVFLTYSVILVTLIIPPLTLPLILRFMSLPVDNARDREEAMARYEATKSALAKIGEHASIAGTPPKQIEHLRERYQRRLKTIEPNLREDAHSAINVEDQHLRRLLQTTSRWERETLQSLRQGGQIHDEVFHALSYELDLEELRLSTPRL